MKLKNEFLAMTQSRKVLKLKKEDLCESASLRDKNIF